MRCVGSELQASWQPLDETLGQMRREFESLEAFTHSLLDELHGVQKELLQRAAALETLQTELSHQRRENVRLTSRFEQQEAQLATTLHELLQLKDVVHQARNEPAASQRCSHVEHEEYDTEEFDRLRDENEQLLLEREELLREREQQETQVQEELQTLRNLAASLLERTAQAKKPPAEHEATISARDNRTPPRRPAPTTRRDTRRPNA